jgi:hypothetical protein
MFSKYGKLNRCDLRESFAFMHFEKERDAEEAFRELQARCPRRPRPGRHIVVSALTYIAWG